MRELEINHININEINYPIYCDLNVLEAVQEEFKSVGEFERQLKGLTVKHDENGDIVRNENGSILHDTIEPRIKAVVYALYIMVAEGQRIEKNRFGIETEPLPIDVIREFNHVNYVELSGILGAEFDKCFSSKKNLMEKKTRRRRKKIL